VEQGASDLFLSAGRPATLRVGGALRASAEVIPTDAQIEALFGPHLGPAQRRRFEELGSVDLSYTIPAGAEGESLRYRVSLFRQEQGIAAAVRPVARRIPRLAELRLPAELGRLVEHRHGLVLMTGPTGSGKSTTLAALIAQLLGASPRHVITIEDPIEFRYPPGRGLAHQREVGAHVATFADGVRSALRSAPDVILVGEMRDPETISAALTAAETGHLVLSTLHCGTAGMAVDRIVDGFPQARQRQVRLQLSDVLRSVVSQRLLPGRAGGRVPAVEILHVTHAVAALIREGRSHQIPSLIQTGRESGMVPLDRSLADLVRRGEITQATALGAAEDPAGLRRLLG
jgi:twitching motility protein PilT